MLVFINTVWPEIMAGRYFGGLLKICHLAELTLAVEPVLPIMILIAKWLIERARSELVSTQLGRNRRLNATENLISLCYA